MASLTNQSMFEALFQRRLSPTGPFADALRAEGYDVSAPQAVYPTEVWTRCLEVARAHRWPSVSAPAAYRALGREFTEGFLDTSEGRLLGAALPLMSPHAFVQRLANYLRLGRHDAALTFDITTETPTLIVALVHNPSGVSGEFVAGLVDTAFARFGVQWSVDVEQTTPFDYRLLIRLQ